jgi:hypothetical protein
VSKTIEAKMAIREATRMHLHHQDPYYIGKTMLRQSYRIRLLENVLLKTQAYILSCEGSKAEAELVAAIDKVNCTTSKPDNTNQRIFIN